MKEVSYSLDAPNPLFEFYYSDTTNNDFLKELREKYQISLLISESKNDFDKVLAVLEWTSKQWEHNGRNVPTRQDALTILQEAKEGKKFRCVEYGIVTTAALNSIGLKSRTLGLKTRDVEKVRVGAGHVVSEVYLKEFKKWIFIDSQFNIVLTVDGVPLNGVEFQKAIYNKNNKLRLINNQGELAEEDAGQYIQWIGKYLFFFDILFDQKSADSNKIMAINGMTKVTLVPIGYKEPRIFQRNNEIDYSYYTRSLNDFYREPK